MNIANTPSLHHTYTVPGKILLLGEHIALHHCPAAGFPIQESLSIKFFKDDTHNHVQPIGYPLVIQSKQHPISTPFIQHLLTVCSKQNLRAPQGIAYIDSIIPLGRGFGSSASLSVALAQIILHYNTPQYTVEHIPKHDIWRLAHMLEQFFHECASGIDTAICTYQQPILLHPTHSFKSDELAFTVQTITMPLHIGYASVPRNMPCASLIKKVSTMIEQPNHFTPLKQETQNGISLLLELQTPHTTTLPKLTQALHATINTIHTLLCNLHISTNELNNGIKTAIANGAQSGKLSGGGGGGAFVYLCNTQDEYDTVRDVIQEI